VFRVFKTEKLRFFLLIYSSGKYSINGDLSVPPATIIDILKSSPFKIFFAMTFSISKIWNLPQMTTNAEAYYAQ
jgi:hypothetical protein